jgi:hypothetical protein
MADADRPAAGQAEEDERTRGQFAVLKRLCLGRNAQARIPLCSWLLVSPVRACVSSCRCGVGFYFLLQVLLTQVRFATTSLSVDEPPVLLFVFVFSAVRKNTGYSNLVRLSASL